MRIRTAFAFLLVTATPVLSGAEFGTKEEARALAEDLVAIINTNGIAAAAQAVVDPEQAFLTSRMGVNLFHGATVIADNREPESVASDYSQTADLTGELVWPRISAAAEIGDDAVLKWYHYDTQEEYDYHCFSLRAARDNGAVMICR